MVEDQDLDGWTVEAILVDRVVLRHADTRLEVKAKDAPPNPTQMNLAPAPTPPIPPKGPGATAAGSIQANPQAAAPK